jgi:hypothetical protein
MNTQTDDAWTGQFVKRKIEKHDNVELVELLDDKLLRVHRKKYDPVVAATMAVDRLDAVSFRTAVNGAISRPDYVVNVPVEAIVLGDAIQLARQQGIGIGQFRDFMAALASSDVALHRSSDIRFVEESLPQHSRVKAIEPLADRHYRIERHGLPPVEIVFLNQYDLTVDHIRIAKKRYGSFDAIVLTNPNGGATSEAKELATSMNCLVYLWKTFLGALKKRKV